jgi:hypothetical protein
MTDRPSPPWQNPATDVPGRTTDLAEVSECERREAVFRRAVVARQAFEQHVQDQTSLPGHESLLGGCKPCMLAGIGRRAEGCAISVELRDAERAAVDALSDEDYR